MKRKNVIVENLQEHLDALSDSHYRDIDLIWTQDSGEKRTLRLGGRPQMIDLLSLESEGDRIAI